MKSNIGGVSSSTIVAGVVANGVGNRVLVDNSRSAHYYGGGGRGNRIDPSAGVGLAVVLILAVAGAAWWFAKNASTYFPLAGAIAMSEAGLALFLCAAKAYMYGMIAPGRRDAAVFGIASVLVLVVYMSAASYPHELARLAMAATSTTGFWCSLTDYGRHLAVGYCAIAGLVSLSIVGITPQILLSTVHAFLGVDGVYRRIHKVAGDGWLVAGAVCCVAGAGSGLRRPRRAQPFGYAHDTRLPISLISSDADTGSREPVSDRARPCCLLLRPTRSGVR